MYLNLSAQRGGLCMKISQLRYYNSDTFLINGVVVWETELYFCVEKCLVSACLVRYNTLFYLIILLLYCFLIHQRYPTTKLNQFHCQPAIPSHQKTPASWTTNIGWSRQFGCGTFYYHLLEYIYITYRN